MIYCEDCRHFCVHYDDVELYENNNDDYTISCEFFAAALTNYERGSDDCEGFEPTLESKFAIRIGPKLSDYDYCLLRRVEANLNKELQERDITILDVYDSLYSVGFKWAKAKKESIISEFGPEDPKNVGWFHSNPYFNKERTRIEAHLSYDYNKKCHRIEFNYDIKYDDEGMIPDQFRKY